MDIIAIESKTFEQMKGRFEDFTRQIKILCGDNQDKEQWLSKLGKHYGLNFEAGKENWTVANENMTKIFNVVSRIRKQQKETAQQRLEVLETQAKDNRAYFNLRKTSVVITVLGLLVLTLTVFCMKQQNDYTLLLDEFYRLILENKPE